MPNLPPLPSAKVLLAGDQNRGDYGDHAEFAKVEDAVVLRADGIDLVKVGPNGHDPEVDLGNLSTSTVPYVNVFLADHGIRVERYWRTKKYRIVSGTAKVVANTQSFVLQQPTGEAIQAVIDRVSAIPVDVFDPSAAIPGVEKPEPVKVKTRAGWANVGGIVVPEKDLDTLNDAWMLRQAGVPASVLVTGPAGTAKTALVRAFAASLGVEFLKVDGGAIRTADDWAGAFRQDPNTKTWQHRWSPFARVLQRGIPTVVLIDEVNRTESTQALNALLGLCDWTGTLLVPDANAVLTLPPGILIVATANIGPEFVGTLPLDGAVRQRFPFGVRLDYPDPKIETRIVTEMTGLDAEHAERLVTLADLQRQNREDPQQYPSGAVISTRVVLDIAKRIVTCQRDPRDAVVATLAAQFDPGDEAALSVLIDSQYPVMVEIEDDTVSEIEDGEDIRSAVAEQIAKSTGDPVAIRLAKDHGTLRCDKCYSPIPVDQIVCPACGQSNAMLKTAHEAVAKNREISGVPTGRSLITVAKHHFVNRGMDGQLRNECQYRHDPQKPDVCGKPKTHNIHH